MSWDAFLTSSAHSIDYLLLGVEAFSAVSLSSVLNLVPQRHKAFSLGQNICGFHNPKPNKEYKKLLPALKSKSIVGALGELRLGSG